MIDDSEIMAVLAECGGSQRKAAGALGIPRTTLQRRLKRMALKGYSPQHGMTKTCPEGFQVKGVSTLYDGEGNIRSQWYKTSPDWDARLKIIEATCEALASDVPKFAPIKQSGAVNKDLLATYIFGDPHFGMMGWAAETGDNYDLKIATRVHCQAMKHLVDGAPSAETALVVNLGDLLHYDSMEAKTPRSGHAVDADGRYARMLDVTIAAMRTLIDEALRKHKTVRVISAIGNHDETGALAVARCLAIAYEREKRVSVDTSPSVFNYFRFGKVLLGVHHGHTCKPDKLPGVMATDMAKDWGESVYRHWLMGHIHHASLKEYAGCTVESFNTLAGKDAYAANGGWRSQRSAQCLTYHSEYGIVGRQYVFADMFKEG